MGVSPACGQREDEGRCHGQVLQSSRRHAGGLGRIHPALLYPRVTFLLQHAAVDGAVSSPLPYLAALVLPPQRCLVKRQRLAPLPGALGNQHLHHGQGRASGRAAFRCCCEEQCVLCTLPAVGTIGVAWGVTQTERFGG